ncbi:positive activator of transcription [Fusarium albosuccineum]|uniref:Positive activator of transcription n=1 Tax=Fusarium albosuccineum TaxID=1237068 RepID=A0A8H4P743_9HYPO|nr:positive activator of transcription [Fusarium albosuccineum]
MASSADNITPDQTMKDSTAASSYGPPDLQVPRIEEEAKAPLINPLAFHTYDWVSGPKGQIVFMGTSSNWSFGRRVLTMTHERLTGTPLPLHNLHFGGLDGKIYDLKWDGNRRLPPDTLEPTALPTQDFALYLINSVKFHCSWLFNLFEEDRFMEHFRLFHERPLEYSRVASLWYVHYLLVLAFGKAFVVQSTKSRRPPGGEFFMQAMKLMPDFTFFEADPVEQMQVLCCAALYLHCVDHLTQAYRLMSTALRLSLEHGMHTEMQSHTCALDETYVQRCRTMFWTVYILERQMVSQMGLPIGIADETISTRLPTFPGEPQRLAALKIQVDFCRVLAKIDNTVYGLEGKLDSRYLGATQSVLRSIAAVTEQLNKSFEIHANEGMAGISRMSAHLHLMQHQCIILTTRPLLYTFLLSRLGHLEEALIHWLQSESVKGLINMCTESAQQILRMLAGLSDQGLLETFLPFDLSAVFTSTIVLLMAAGIDSSLLQDHTPWSQRAYAIFDEMNSRGNLVAGMVASELKQLDGLLSKYLIKDGEPRQMPSTHGRNTPRDLHTDDIDASSEAVAGYPPPFDLDSTEDFGLGLNYELSAEQLMNVADSLDIDSLQWPWPEENLAGDEGQEP